MAEKLQKFDVALRPVRYACVSGGKDSLFMLKVILENQDKYPVDIIFHSELEIDYPWIANVITYVEEVAKKAGIKFIKLKPRTSFFELYERFGYPTRVTRWCNRMYKVDSTTQLENWIKSQSCRPVAYIGLCADEVKRHKYTIGDIQDGQNIIYPLAEEGYNEDDILRWARTQPIFNDYYKFNKRQGCMYCPMSGYANLAYLLWKYPAEYENMMTMVKASENKTGHTVFQSNPKYNAEYVDNIVRTKWTKWLKNELVKWGMAYDNN